MKAFIFSSLIGLTICFSINAQEQQPVSSLSQTLSSLRARPLSTSIVSAEQPRHATEEKATGPLLGHVDAEQALVWYRPVEAGDYTLLVKEKEQAEDALWSYRSTVKAEKEDDLCITWRVPDLAPNTVYQYQIRQGGAEGPLLADGPDYHFRTPPLNQTPREVTLAFGSCASSTKFFEIWEQIDRQQIEGLVLLGDTPYIDSSDVLVNRNRHREFLQIPTLAAMGKATPIWGTWDDHDFGGNDTDGTVKDKQIIRKVFTEYRAHDQFGNDQQGIYTRFRRGPVEVFLLDARYFAQTEPSPVDAEKKTCLGQRQWKWLLEGLTQSTAPFKIIASGQIWDDKTNGEKDDWHTYAHEREALLDFIEENEVGGVILMGGDIHASRALRYDERVGYPLWQFIVSPMHDSTIPSLNVPHPNLIWGAPVPNVFLRIVADNRSEPATLVATWLKMDGQPIYEVRLTSPADGQEKP